MSVRWQCPVGDHSTVLGPERPRKDNACRYCLQCTEKTGKLTERVAPALERRRLAAAEAAEKKRKAREARARDREREKLTVNGIHLPSEAARMVRRSQTLRVTWRLRADQIEFKVRRRTTAATGRYGHAWGNWEIQVNDVPGLDVYDTLETLIHELVHCALPDDVHHGELFHNTLDQAFLEVYGLRPRGARTNRWHGRYAAALRHAAEKTEATQLAEEVSA